MCMIQGMQSRSWLLRQYLCPHTHSGTTGHTSRIGSSDFATSELSFCSSHTLPQALSCFVYALVQAQNLTQLSVLSSLGLLLHLYVASGQHGCGKCTLFSGSSCLAPCPLGSTDGVNQLLLTTTVSMFLQMAGYQQISITMLTACSKHFYSEF